MGEARRRANQGMPPRKQKLKEDNLVKRFPWLPVSQNPRQQFYEITNRGAWIGIGLLVVLWIVVRFVGPALGWWTPADIG